jgi:predicted dithiol-disulfide oxidoreductase (DUF899 family)
MRQPKSDAVATVPVKTELGVQPEPAKIVSPGMACRALCSPEEFTHRRDQLSAERRALPWVKVEKEYVFDTLNGSRTLPDLFDGRSQLVVDHFMLGPGWKEGCVGCSFGADHMGNLVHLEHHDVTVVVVSRAPLVEIEAYRKRMGWGFTWVSSYGSDFNYDYHVLHRRGNGEGQGLLQLSNDRFRDRRIAQPQRVLTDEAGNVFPTYASYARGAEDLITAYMVLDLTPKGRNETGPHHNLMDWVRRHDEYDKAEDSRSCCAEQDSRR